MNTAYRFSTSENGEAKETLVCHRLFMQQLNKENFPELALKYYQGEKNSPAHYLVLAEVLSIETEDD